MNTNNNPFDQNKDQSSPENIPTQENPYVQGYPHLSQGEQNEPSQTENARQSESTPTYGQIYTPENSDGPRPQGGSYSSSPYSGAYTPYGNMPSSGSAPYGYNTNSAQTSQKKKKNGATIAIVCCCIVAALVVIGCVFFAMMNVGNIFGINPNPGIVDADTTDDLPSAAPDTDTDSGENTNDETETGNSNSGSPSVSKNPGETTDVSGGKIGELMTMSEAVALIKDSVVEINTEQMVTGSFYEQYIASGAGSGVIVAKEGYIITNNHVVAGASTIKITLTNGNKYDAELIGTDATTDIAVLKIEPKETLTAAVLGSSDKLVLAQDVIVIGNPLGSLGGTVTCGIISALDRQITVEGEKMTLLQTNAAVNPGNSGGGMFNLRGELVGIVNAKSTGEDVEGLGFAIPIDTAYNVFNQLVEYGYVRGRVDHGLSLVDINDWFMASAYRVNTFGVYVLESKYSDDIRNGDRIVSINGIEVLTSSEVTAALSDCAVGDKVNLVLARSGKTIEATLTLREYNPTSNGDVSFD